MCKFDLSEKIKPTDLINALIDKSKVNPLGVLKKELKVSGDWQANYFNWGRNALYYLFKSLPYKTITFPAFTCPTIVEPAEQAGKEVILTEIDLDTFNLDIDKIPFQTECLVVVHTFGNPVNIAKIRKKLGKVFIIEDCAHALFSRVNNKFVGNAGNVVLFSLYKQVANLNGALLLSKEGFNFTQEQESNFNYLKRLIIKTAGFHQYCLNLKKQQYLPSIEPQELNANKPSRLVFNLFEKGFRKLEKEIEARRKIADLFYQEAEKSKFIICQKPGLGSKPSYYHFVIRLTPELAPLREKIVLALRKKNIFIDRLWYTAPITEGKYKAFQKKCPQALLLAQTVINLPIYSWYTKKDAAYLFDQINKTIDHLK